MSKQDIAFKLKIELLMLWYTLYWKEEFPNDMPNSIRHIQHEVEEEGQGLFNFCTGDFVQYC